MNVLQRETISDIYKQHIKCGFSSDPAGFYNDFRDFIGDIRRTDKKLNENLKEIEDELYDK